MPQRIAVWRRAIQVLGCATMLVFSALVAVSCGSQGPDEGASKEATEPLVLVIPPCNGGAAAQTFPNGMIGCSGNVSWVNRGLLCGALYRPASAAEWAALHGSVAPTHDYWTSDDLHYSGVGSASCSATMTSGNACPAGQPMRVCTPGGARRGPIPKATIATGPTAASMQLPPISISAAARATPRRVRSAFLGPDAPTAPSSRSFREGSWAAREPRLGTTVTRCAPRGSRRSPLPAGHRSTAPRLRRTTTGRATTCATRELLFPARPRSPRATVARPTNPCASARPRARIPRETLATGPPVDSPAAHPINTSAAASATPRRERSAPAPVARTAPPSSSSAAG